ncbi:MAG: acetyltransferase [Weeksellaceae bacterium]
MKDIYILGSGGFAKEVYFLIKEIGHFKVKAFVDIEKKGNISFSETSIPVISEEELEEKEIDKISLALGLGDPKLIKKLSDKFKSYHFPNLIHPNVIYDKSNINIGKGNIVTAGVIMTTHINIGNYNIFNLSTTVGHDVEIGNCNIFNPSVNISGEVKIGDNNLFGVGSVVLQQKTIGNNNILGASSLLTKNMNDDLVFIGVPAKQLNK